MHDMIDKNKKLQKVMNSIYVSVDSMFKRIQDIVSPRGSYAIASIPFVFLYWYSIEHIKIEERVLILVLVIVTVLLNLFNTTFAFFPIAILLFFSMWGENIIFALIILLILAMCRDTNMVKKGKYVYPLIIMFFISGIFSSPIPLIISWLFVFSLMLGDRINIIPLTLASFINVLISSTTFNLITNSQIMGINEKIYPLNLYFTNTLKNYVSFDKSVKALSLLFDGYASLYITFFVGVVLITKIFISIVDKYRINKLKLGYILISHLYAVFAIYIIHQLSILIISTNMAIKIKSSEIYNYNFWSSLNNIPDLIPTISLMLKNGGINSLSFSHCLIAFFASLPLSLFVNGYESQKSMISKKNISSSSGPDENDIHWDDIAGYESTKREIIDTISPFIDESIKLKLINANMNLPKGILLFGPPGCGKTMFAKAIATETGMNFISIKGNEFTSKWVGESEKNLREIFESARRNPPSIIFFDELEAFLFKRENVVNEHNKSLVTTFLTEMDGFVKDDRYLIIGATNNPDMLDSAAIRPGRFDKCIYIDTPNSAAREAIICKYLDKKGKFTKEEINDLVNSTRRYSGADIRAIIEEAFRKNRFNSINSAMVNEMLSHYKPTMDYEMQKKYNKIQAKYNRSSISQEDIEIDKHKKVTWEDAPGMEDIQKQIKELIEKPLKFSKKYKELGIDNSKGILMYGPPGCGKTLVSKIIASEYDLHFILVNGPELLSKNIGESEEQIRKVFMEAKDNAPSIIFFDEFDSIAETRSSQIGQTKVINQLLTEMDGNQGLEKVIVVGATNRIEVIDPALKRPGRFDKILYVGLPNEKSRKQQFKLYLSKLKGKYNFEEFAKSTEMFTCADIGECCKKIMLKELDLSISDENRHITQEEILDIINHSKPSLTKKEIEHYENLSHYERK